MTQFGEFVWEALASSKAKGNQLTIPELELLGTSLIVMQGKEAFVKKTIAEVSEQFERRELQRQENIEIGDDTADGFNIHSEPLSLDDAEENLVFTISGCRVGDLRDKSVFKLGEREAQYVASYTQTRDKNGEEKTYPTMRAWYTSPRRKTVAGVTWRPEAGAFTRAPDGALSGGRTDAFNTWRGLPAYDVPLDWEDRAAIWDEHLEYLIPDAVMLERFRQWLAHIIQKPGELPATAFCMIAETHGIGRNWMASVLVRVLRGYVRASLSLDQFFGKQFNGTISQKLLAVVDEVHERQSRDRYETANRLRQMITAEHNEINHKYGGNFIEYNCLRWLFFSNYLDALPVGDKDRRIEFIENPKQCRSYTYYGKLFNALKDPSFIASVRHRLGTTDISGFDPGKHAMKTEFRAAAITASQSGLERLIQGYLEHWQGTFTTLGHLTDFIRAEDDGKTPGRQLVTAVARQFGLHTSNVRISPDGRDGRKDTILFNGRMTTALALEGADRSMLVRTFNGWRETFEKDVYGASGTLL